MSPCSDEEYYYKLDNMVIGSTQHIRQVFKTRWKVESGEDWRDEPDFINNFLTQHSANILKKAMPSQKNILLLSCSCEDWDISLMSLVLLNFGDRTKYNTQNQAVRQLKDLRNILAHHKSKKITQTEYCEKVKIFKDSLQTLEMKKTEIAKLVKGSSVSSSSSEDTERLKQMLGNAEKFMKLQDFASALQQYSEAITIPRLSPINLGEVYEERAACYLSITDNHISDTNNIDQAVLDVQEALKLNKSWNAHYLKAQCHKLKNNLAEAIRNYEMALAISPVQKQIKRDLDSCKLLMSAQKTNAQLNHCQLPITASEIVENLNVKNESGRNLTFKEFYKWCGFNTHPTHVGHQYYNGWGVAQDYAKAFKYFSQADKQGFAEGSYKVGLCYYRGHGVQQDVGKAVEIYKRVAAMDPKKKSQFEKFSPLGFNYGVAFAEDGLGKCYEEGMGVEKNLYEAAVWYKRGMEHGHASSATSLGMLYGDGRGVPQNEKMAEMCWKQGLNLGNITAAEILVDYYHDHLEPEMAWNMLSIAREMGHEKFLAMSDEEFNQGLTMVQSERCRLEKEVLEHKYNMDYKGMTFRQRFIRAQQQQDPNFAKMQNMRTNDNVCGGQIQTIGKNVMVEVGIKALHGSKIAMEVLETMDSISELNELLATPNDLSKRCQLKAANLFYECITREDHLKCFVKNAPKFQAIVADLFNETCEQIGEEEMKIRLCYVGYNLWSSLKSANDLYALGILKEGIRRYPDNYGYTRLLIYCLKKRKSYEDALQSVNEASKRFPEKVDLYFLKADILLKIENIESSKIIAAFQMFLDNAPRDHRFVPEAYYKISFLSMKDYIRDKQASNLEYHNKEKLMLIMDNFGFGKKAENEQLPCYLPYGKSDCQSILEGFLGEIDQKCGIKRYSTVNTVTPSSVEGLKSVLERKEYLNSPVRKGLILQHRGRLIENMGLTLRCVHVDNEVFPEERQQKRAKKMAHLKSITLQEMNPTKDQIYENRILDLTIIEEPNLYLNSIQLVVEDDNGDTARAYVDRPGTEIVLLERVVVGSRIAVINPYMGSCSLTSVNGIIINEEKCIVYLEKVKDMCRFCGEENAKHECSKCKRLYCSRECQKWDGELFEHKLICPAVPEIKK